MSKYISISAIVTSLILIGCSENTNTPFSSGAFADQAAFSRLQQLDDSRRQLSESVAGRRKNIALLQQQAYNHESTLRKYKADVQRYMMRHKMAVASIASAAGGGAIALDSDNEFSDDAQKVAGIVGAFGALYAIANFDEVSEVADQMVQADSHVKSLEQQIKATMQKIVAEKRSLDSSNAHLQKVEQQLEQVRTRE